jgi:signal transduction histidine kinase
MAGGLAHQIRNPLNYVKSALGTIRRDAEKVLSASKDPRNMAELEAIAARLERMFETAETGVRRIASTVDLMVRYSRDGYTRAPQPYDAFAAIRDVVSLVLPSADGAVEVAMELEGDGNVRCVPEELNQALTNIVENAIDAVPPDRAGRIEIRGKNDGASLFLSIKDNGVGIGADDLPKIFTAFYTTKQVGKGMGMGLTIARRVVTALGGTIDVSSRVGAGTEFTVRVPIDRIESRANAQPAMVEASP